MSCADSRYAHHPDVAWRLIQEEALLVDPHTGRIFPLNAVAARIWVLLGEGLSVSAINDILFEEFDMSRDTIRADADDFVARLLEANLLVKRSGERDREGSGTR